VKKNNLTYLFCFFLLGLFSQNKLNETENNKKSILKNQIFDEIKGIDIKFSGYARMFVHHRALKNFETYDSLTNVYIAPKKLTFGDGNREPILALNTNLTHKSGISLATDFFIFTPFNGSNLGNTFSNNIMLNLYGTIPTTFGKFTIKTGGIHWYNISDFTMSTADITRYSVFTRTPWEGAGNSQEKYSNYHKLGNIDQNERFSQQAFKGFILEGADLPKGFSFNFLFGKNANNVNDITVLPDYVPNYTIAGKVENLVAGKHKFGINTINSVSFDNKNRGKKSGFNMVTLSHRWFLKKLLVEGEVGVGSFTSPTYQRKWDPGVKIKFNLPKEYTFLPMDFQFFYIGKNFVNNIGAFSNTSISQLLFLGRSDETNATSSNILQPFASPIINVGFATNNRWGIHYNTEFEFKALKLNLGYSISQELENLGSDISVNHRINGVMFSRLYFFQANKGPYERFGTFFRGAYEIVNVPGLDTTTTNKSFNTIEFQAKYDLKINKRHLYFFYYTSLNSVQNKLAAGPLFSNKAWVRAFYNELEVYAEVFPKLHLSAYVGLEQIMGNMETRLNTETLKPVNQLNYAYGFGIDYDIAKNAGIYIRQRWFHHEDKNFIKEKLFGTETEIELKVFF
jgi:hypothetical protein